MEKSREKTEYVLAGKARAALPATQGSRYNVGGIEVVESEVHDDYIILLVKPL
jgi:hypothetical protein